MIAHALIAFGTVFLAELPDKSMFVSLVLTTRYRRPLAVWCGVVTAFAVHVAAAVLLGSVLRRLPHRPLGFAVGLLFLIGAAVLWRSHDQVDEHDVIRPASSFLQIAIASGSVLFLAEFGDLTQLATAGLASRTGDPIAVAGGAWSALATVAALAVTVGGWIERRISMSLVRRSAGTLFAFFGAWSLIVAIRG